MTDDNRTDLNEVKPLADAEESIVPVDGYGVHEWSPDADHACGPTQVHVVLPMHDVVPGLAVALRLKSARACQQLIDTLIKHRDGVWPAN